ncbi:MAG: porin family protein [Bacteroidia bacterium]|nr:porin family protein [Bacteroidia bacterium]
MKYITGTFLFIVFLFTYSFSQDTIKSQPLSPALPADDLPSDPPSRFDLVFNRGLMLVSSTQDSVPISGSNSGTFFIGGGIKFPLAKNKMGIRVTPGVAFSRIQYNQTTIKTFPTIPDSLSFTLTSEKHSLTYVELPLGFYLNISRDEDNDPKFFVEAGGYVGYLLSASYKTKYVNSDGQRVKTQVSDLEKIEAEFERIRYGLYGRLGYKWASLYYSFRLSALFDEFANDPPRGGQGYKNPVIPPMEVGLTIFL